MYLKVDKKWQFAFDIVMIVLGTIIMGFAFSIFLEPNNISTGGFSGLSMIINSLLHNVGVTFLSSSAIYLILNVGLFLYALKTLGKKFAIKSIVGIVSFSGAMEIFKLLPINITYETLISAVYGGALMGIGVGLVVRFGGSTGGSDIIASIVRSKKPTLTIGKLVVSVDMCVIILSLFAFSNGMALLPYTILALLLALFTTDFVNEGYKQVRAYSIVTSRPEELANELMTKLSRGCTLTKVQGMHTKSDKYILTCLVSKFQSSYLKRLVSNIDENAFMYSTPVSEVIGSWAKESELPKEEQNKKSKSKSKNINKSLENTNNKEEIKEVENKDINSES